MGKLGALCSGISDRLHLNMGSSASILLRLRSYDGKTKARSASSGPAQPRSTPGMLGCGDAEAMLRWAVVSPVRFDFLRRKRLPRLINSPEPRAMGFPGDSAADSAMAVVLQRMIPLLWVRGPVDHHLPATSQYFVQVHSKQFMEPRESLHRVAQAAYQRHMRPYTASTDIAHGLSWTESTGIFNTLPAYHRKRYLISATERPAMHP